MTYGEKYKTQEERMEAFHKWCKDNSGNDACIYRFRKAHCCTDCVFIWLDLEAPEERIEPCPFCGNKCESKEFPDINEAFVVCTNVKCHYTSGDFETEKNAIAAHNRVVKAVMAAKEGESK